MAYCTSFLSTEIIRDFPDVELEAQRGLQVTNRDSPQVAWLCGLLSSSPSCTSLSEPGDNGKAWSEPTTTSAFVARDHVDGGALDHGFWTGAKKDVGSA